MQMDLLHFKFHPEDFPIIQHFLQLSFYLTENLICESHSVNFQIRWIVGELRDFNSRKIAKVTKENSSREAEEFNVTLHPIQSQQKSCRNS